jgi:2-oxoglutarate dehydrogenase E1 component
MFRVRGHLLADLNPLGQKYSYNKELDPAFYGFTIWDYDRIFFTANLQGMDTGTLREIMDVLHKTYCEKIGIEFMHIQNQEEKQWLQEKMEPVLNKAKFDGAKKKRILEKLIIAETFEHFLHTKFVGHKRFSLEGKRDSYSRSRPFINTCSRFRSVGNPTWNGTPRKIKYTFEYYWKSYEKIFSEFEEDIDPDHRKGQVMLNTTSVLREFIIPITVMK